METWVDASRLDLVGYQPKLLGQTDETAAEGLAGRMNGLIEFSKQHAKRMLPLVQANNKAAVEPIETEVAVETAKVTADVVHTLLVLTARSKGTGTASLIARVSAPPVAGMEFVPAKLMLAGTNYSTLSEPLIETPKEYRASFVFHNLPAGSYQAIVERTGARPLVTGRLVLHPGRTLHVNRQLQPTDPAENLVRNPRFGIRWRGKSTPDSWHFDGPQDHWLPDTRDRVRDHWISDTIPVEGGKTYVAGYEAKPSSRTKVMLQWMVTHWKAIDRPLVVLRPGKTAPAGERFTAPPKAVYARFVVAGSSDPAKSVQEVFLTPKP
ncbi:MAG TPA: hypothetical protein VF283_08275 [Bryobacteraceae bacterium]|nr:hypothetical protein [Candidatus Acidoferrales bacterium]